MAFLFSEQYLCQTLSEICIHISDKVAVRYWAYRLKDSPESYIKCNLPVSLEIRTDLIGLLWGSKFNS